MTMIFHSSTTAIPPLGGTIFYTGTMLFDGSSWQVIYLKVAAPSGGIAVVEE